jgi:quercetin dioxygenase-like cupin family protein
VSEPVLIPPGGGEVIGDSPERRVEILSDDDALNATWSRFGPGREGADLHVHRLHHDLFYVLAGELTVRLGLEDETVVAPAGTLARVPPNVVHGFRNGSDRELRYLNLHAPGQRFADYLRAVRDRRRFSYDQHDPPADGGRPIGDAVVGGATVVTDEPGLRVTTLVDVAEIAVTETWSEPGPGALRERDALLSLYVLEGALSIATDGRELAAGTGTWVQLRPGTPHTVSVSGGPARFLEIRTPVAPR